MGGECCFDWIWYVDVVLIEFFDWCFCDVLG